VFTARYGLNFYILFNVCLIRVNDNCVLSKLITTLNNGPSD
jgi:hypothetical protein